MYFNDMMFNPQYVNLDYYRQIEQQKKVEYQQNEDTIKAINAMHDLLEAVKKLDKKHQEIAFYGCLAEVFKATSENRMEI